jgi:preprotein translocase subunit SecG
VVQNAFTFLLIINSVILLGLILNQNESAKDVASNTNTQVSNPLENLTWISVFFEFLLLLLKSKFNAGSSSFKSCALDI